MRKRVGAKEMDDVAGPPGPGICRDQRRAPVLGSARVSLSSGWTPNSTGGPAAQSRERRWMGGRNPESVPRGTSEEVEHLPIDSDSSSGPPDSPLLSIQLPSLPAPLCPDTRPLRRFQNDFGAIGSPVVRPVV